MRQFLPAGPRSARFAVLAVVSTVVCLGIFAAAAAARFQADSVVPVFCTNDSIPANTQLTLRLRWGVSNDGQMKQFLEHQKMTWTVYAADGTTVLAASAAPAPEFGDTTWWSPAGHDEQMITTRNGDVKKQKFTYSDYRQATGVTVGLNQTVIVAYELSADAATDDGFGWKFLEPGTISAGSSCRVTGV